MTWFWVVGAIWLLLAVLIALLIGRAIHRADDPEEAALPAAEEAGRPEAPTALTAALGPPANPDGSSG